MDDAGPGWTFEDPRAGRREKSRQFGETTRLSFATPAALAGLPVPERRWVVPGWLPAGTVSLIYGFGGEGKTLLLQQLLTSVASGALWCGLSVRRGVALGLFTEDDEDEMHRRQAAINAALGVDYADLSDMWWTCPIGSDNTFLRFDRDGFPEPTDRFADFAETAREMKPAVIALDVAADLYGGNENDRGQVAQFLKAQLGSLARDTGAAVILAAHPSKSSKASGDLDSGSTGWNGGVRTRLTLMTPEGDADSPRDETARVLCRAKANYARRGDTIDLAFRDGVLMPKQGMGGGFVAAMNRHNQEQRARDVFLRLLDGLAPTGRHASESRNSANYAPKLFSRHPGREGFRERDFVMAMNRLFAEGVIRVEAYGKPSDKTRHIARVPPGEGSEEGGEGGGEG